MSRKAYRKSKKRITYDSNETKSLFGLIFLFLGVLTLLSYFLTGGIFLFLKNLTGTATIFLTILLFDLCLYLFRSKFPIATGRSIIAQVFFLLAYAGFINSIFGGGYTLQPSQGAEYGGIVGFYLYRFLSENIFLNFTPVFFFVIILFSVPVALSMSISQFMEVLGKIFLKIWSLFKKPKIEQVERQTMDIPLLKPSTFGDFRKNKAKSDGVDQAKPMEEARNEKTSVADISGNKVSEKSANVEIKEVSREGAFVNEELKYPDWKLPPLSLLNTPQKITIKKEDISKNADIIEQTLNSFGVKAKVVDVLVGPSVTQYALDIALGTKVSKIANLSNDMALALATSSNSLRIEAPIPGTSYVGIEIPNAERALVYSKEIMSGPVLGNAQKFQLPIGLGKNISGEKLAVNLQKMPHILVAGATGSGKSVLTNSFIASLLMTKTPDEVKFIMVDPKQVELSDYNGIAHLLTPVITEMDKVLNALKWAIAEMESRYTIFRLAKVRNIEAYNKLMGFSALPYIVIVIDEMADMMMSTNKVETETAIVRLAQKARATGIHLILATQRPSVDVITGLIKANIPARVGMSVTTQIDSRVIMDQIGSESLLGNGDMLFKDPSFGKPVRIQGMWMAPEEIQRIVQYIKDQVPEVHYTKEVIEKKVDPKDETNTAEADSLSSDNQFENAVHVIVNAQKGSASLLQRKLSLGYNRAARILDELEELGVVGAPNGSKPRDVLITDADAFLNSLKGKPPEPSEIADTEDEFEDGSV
ncbi:MAG: DNA translocase FtsK [bacterium]